MASIARASLHRNNHLANLLFRLSHPPLSAGKAPRGNGVVASLCRSLHSTSIVRGGARAPDDCPLPPHLRDQLCPLRQKVKQQSSSSSDESDKEGGFIGHRKILTVKQTEEAAYCKMEMPGVRKEDVKLYLDHEILTVKGTRKIDPKFDKEDGQDNEEEKTETYMAGVGLVPICLYNVSKIDAEMKDGVLKVMIPKFKDEERTDFKYIPIN